MYKLGLVSVSFRKNTPREILEAMKEADLHYIEWGSDVHCPPESADEIAKLSKEYGIECCSYGTYFKLGVTPIEELYDYAGAAKTLGTNIVRVWCGNKNSQDYEIGERDELFSLCAKAAKIAEECGVILCTECHNKTYTNRKEAAYQLMNAVNSPNFKTYWQPNQFESEEENLAYAKLLSPYTEHIHVFNWKQKEKFPLKDATEIWSEYLKCFDSNKALLLEFMPDNNIDSLKNEANALKEIVKC